MKKIIIALLLIVNIAKSQTIVEGLGMFKINKTTLSEFNVFVKNEKVNYIKLKTYLILHKDSLKQKDSIAFYNLCKEVIKYEDEMPMECLFDKNSFFFFDKQNSRDTIIKNDPGSVDSTVLCPGVRRFFISRIKISGIEISKITLTFYKNILIRLSCDLSADLADALVLKYKTGMKILIDDEDVCCVSLKSSSVNRSVIYIDKKDQDEPMFWIENINTMNQIENYSKIKAQQLKIQQENIEREKLKGL